jgi:hypothetical protein
MKVLNVYSYVYGAELVGYNMFHLLRITDLQKRFTSLAKCAFICNCIGYNGRVLQSAVAL